jgi:hypothetical protein
MRTPEHGEPEAPAEELLPRVLAVLAWMALGLGLILFWALFPGEHTEASRRDLAYLNAGLWLFSGIVLATILLVARRVLPYLRRTSQEKTDPSAKRGTAP